MTDTNPGLPLRMAYQVEYLVNDRPYVASVDTLREALLFAAIREGEGTTVLKITGPDDLLLEGDELQAAIANPPAAPEPVADPEELEP